MWLGGAWKGSLWICYTGPLAGRWKSGISGNQQRSITLGEEQLGKLGKKENEEEEPVTERRREYTDSGLDLDKREEQVASHASVLALVMTDEACREAEI